MPESAWISKTQPLGGWMLELWRARGLALAFAQKDWLVRYHRTRLGWLWLLAQPLFWLALLTLVFGRVLGVEAEVPYAVFALPGVVVWLFFSQGVLQGFQSFAQSGPMFQKVYFPRGIILLSKVLAGLPELAVGVLLFLVFQVVQGIPLGAEALLLLLLIPALVALTFGVSLFLAALAAPSRDLGYAVPYILQLGFFVTPAAFPAGLVGKLGGTATSWFYLNPLAGFLDVARWCLYGAEVSSWAWLSLLTGLLLMVVGLLAFHRRENAWAEIL